ncbi:MAG: hypothetical protein WCR52_19475 [Bacteroidota bacterium]
MRPIQVIFPIFLLFAAACANKTSEAPKAPVNVEHPMVGGDQDAHGCKASAGYTWSVVKNECIRIFESGVRLDPKAPNLDKTMSAFIVFKSEQDDAQVEMFIPGSKESILLKKVQDNGAGTWKNDAMTLKQWKGMYTLEGKDGKVLYEGSAAQ